jgi:nicotinamidase-related amidase
LIPASRSGGQQIRTPIPSNESAVREPEFLDKPPSMTPIRDAVHLCVDMQRIFARGGVWETPWMERVLPVVADIAARFAERTVFTRFITPENAGDRPGQWQAYYRRWQAATRAKLPPDQLELVAELGRYAPPATVIDKPAYSAFYCSRLDGFLQQKSVRTLVVTGAETDICVLSTVLDAVDRGLRVVIVEDALCSSSDAGHEALMTMYRARLREQIELVTSDMLPELWPRA